MADLLSVVEGKEEEQTVKLKTVISSAVLWFSGRFGFGSSLPVSGYSTCLDFAD